MTAKESATWLTIINQEEGLARELYPESCFVSYGDHSSVGLNDCGEYDVEVAGDESQFEYQEQKPINLTLPDLTMEDTKSFVTSHVTHYPFKDIDVNMDFERKRKSPSELSWMAEQTIYTCEYLQCPYSESQHGFHDRTSRDNHQLSCPYRSISSDAGLVQFHEQKSTGFHQSILQPNSTPHQTVVLAPSSFSLSGVGVPEDGQQTINGLMSCYDNSVHTNKLGDFQTLNQNAPQSNSKHQHIKFGFNNSQCFTMDNNNFFDTSNMPAGHIDQSKMLNMNPPQFDMTHANTFQMIYDSPFSTVAGDFTDGIPSTFSKQASLWYS